MSDPKKPGPDPPVHRREDVMTPLEKLASLPDVDDFLRKGITLDQLKEQARGARQMSKPPTRFARRGNV